ncbi:Uncharacterised protein [Vibrio cholerae]|nr:Uncharacterised protein [Vibrio cholerae]
MLAPSVISLVKRLSKRCLTRSLIALLARKAEASPDSANKRVTIANAS